MKTLSDREIGKLWKEHAAQATCSHPYQTVMDKMVLELIRKLVEERREKYEEQGWPKPRTRALREFGLTPEDWEGLKGKMEET